MSGAENKKRLPALPRWVKLLLCAAAIPVVSLALAVGLQNGSTYATGSWDDYSEALVFGRMLQMQQNQSAPGGFMGVYTEDWGDAQNRYLYRDNTPVAPEQYHSYTHQTGLQGWVFGAVNKLLTLVTDVGAARERQLYTLNSALYYMAALWCAVAIGAALGALPAACWAAAALLAPGLQTGMKNLYWCLWLWWLPMLAGLLLCAAARRRGRCPGWCFGAVFAACLVRCLCGFEFISTFLILAETPLVFCWAAEPENRRRWFGRMVRAGLAAVGGVAAALAVWLAQGVLYYGSLAESWQNLTGAAASRMSVTDETVRAGVSAAGVVYKYLFGDATVMLKLGPAKLVLWQVLAIAGGALALTALGFALLRRFAELRALGPAALAWALSFLAPISWMVLSKAHADIHTQLLPMLWHFAFVPASLALVGLLAARWGHLAAAALRRRTV